MVSLTVSEKLTIYKKFNLNKDAAMGFPFNIDILVKLGISLDIQSGPQKEAPIHVCCHYKNFYFLEKLLKYNVNLELKNKQNKTPIMVACESGAANIVEKLLEKSVNLETKDNINKNTALMLACKNGHLNCVRLLYKAGADLNNIGENGYNCLLLAVESENCDLVEYLLPKVDPDFKTSVTNDTALNIATRKGKVKIVKELLKYKVNKSIKNKFSGKTALEIAKENENYILISLLSDKKRKRKNDSSSSSSNKRKK